MEEARRIKNGSKITITAIPARPQWKAVLGSSFSSVNWKKFRGEIIDIFGEAKTTTGKDIELMMIGFWNRSTRCYHGYATNLNVHPNVIYSLYRVRWQIKLQFKVVKSSLHLADIPSANYQIVMNLIQSSIAACLLNKICAKTALMNANDQVQQSFSLQRAATIVKYYCGLLRTWLTSSNRFNLEQLSEKIQKFIRELAHPNYRKRRSSMNALAVLV